MLTLDVSALTEISTEHGLSTEELNQEAGKLPYFLEKIKARNQDFYTDAVLDDQLLLAQIEATTASNAGQYDHIVVLGIGGSALGIRVLAEAFGNLFTGTKPQLIVLDNIDPELIAECRAELNLPRTLFLVITKSGGTPETLSQYFYFASEVRAAGIALEKAFIFITDHEVGFLRAEAERTGIPSFSIPAHVGGRFSVLTAVGLLPARLIGVDVKKLLSGAQTMCDNFLSTEAAINLPFQLAAIQYLLAQKGKTITVLMPYAQKLFRLADWYRQLLAESIGKVHSTNGERIHFGLTPVNALGVTDQHSQSQLYMEGPFDKLLIFLEVEKLSQDQNIPIFSAEDERVGFLKDVSFAELLKTEKAATAEALTTNNRPHVTIKVPEISQHTLGELFMLFEGSVAFLGEFFGIDAFDQPGVELSKKLTKKFLLSRPNR